MSTDTPNNSERNPDAAQSGSTFKKYLESKGHSRGSIESEYRQLCYFLNWCEQEQVESEYATHRDLIGYIQYLQGRKAKQITIQQYLVSVKHYFTWLIKRGICQENPVRNIQLKGIKRSSLHDILKLPELESLYHRFPIPDKHPPAPYLAAKRNKVMLGLMIWQGATTAELQRLQIPELNLREGTVYFAAGRKSNERSLQLQAQQILDLMEYHMGIRAELLTRAGIQTEQFFVTSGANTNLHNAMSYLLKKLKALNPRIQNAKQIRASVIVHWLKVHNLREAQYRAGHRYVSSTESYLVNEVDDLSEEIGKFHPLG